MPYYELHLKALKDDSIMTQIDNPLTRKELREWVWVMLRRARSREKIEEEDGEDLT
jgi:hypothetical protein